MVEIINGLIWPTMLSKQIFTEWKVFTEFEEKLRRFFIFRAQTRNNIYHFQNTLELKD